jgi:asparagine synthase (glutamine-hydrolysing)
MIVAWLPSADRAMKAYVLPREHGVILGRLLPMSLSSWNSRWEPCFEESECEQIISTRGKRLTTTFWGKYVALLSNGESSSRYVVRDCSGGVQCQRTRHDGVDIFFSDVNDLSALRLPSFSLNLPYIAAFIAHSHLQVRECGLTEIKEVLAGECVELKKDTASQFALWNAADVSRDKPLESLNDAREQLRFVTQRCVDMWASLYDCIVHRLSGGLDSAIVLGCLTSSPHRPRITCLNRFTTEAGEDERRYARIAACRAEMELVEYPWLETHATLDDRLIDRPQTSKPTIQGVMGISDAEFSNELAERLGINGIWTGQGGDHLFLADGNALAAADYMAVHGVSLGLLRATDHAARLSRQSFWTVLQYAWVTGRAPDSWRPLDLTEKLPFLTEETRSLRLLEYATESLCTLTRKLPPGKQYQIDGFSDVLNRHRPIPPFERAEEHHPLLSQPLLELCLRIPCYVLTYGGRARSLARQAFVDCVPPEILGRQHKGTTVVTQVDRIRRSAPYLRELLLDGILVKKRILSRAALETYLARDQALRLDDLFPFAACIAAEIWTRRWSSRSLRLAA